jgi:hypothetical protein
MLAIATVPQQMSVAERGSPDARAIRAPGARFYGAKDRNSGWGGCRIVARASARERTSIDACDRGHRNT